MSGLHPEKITSSELLLIGFINISSNQQYVWQNYSMEIILERFEAVKFLKFFRNTVSTTKPFASPPITPTVDLPWLLNSILSWGLSMNSVCWGTCLMLSI